MLNKPFWIQCIQDKQLETMIAVQNQHEIYLLIMSITEFASMESVCQVKYIEQECIVNSYSYSMDAV